MNISSWFSFTFIVLIVATITLLVSKKTHTSQEYFVSNRQTSLFALIATLVMTELNTSTLVGFASLGYKYGFSASYLPLVFLVGLSFYAISVAKKWKQFDGITVTTYFEKRYNVTIGYCAATILLIAMLGFSANYIKSLTLIFEPLFPSLNRWIISGFFCSVMASITLRGGLKSIIRIDIVSFLLTLIVIPTIFYVSFIDVHHSALPAKNLNGPFPIKILVSLIIITMFTYILAPWYGQKIFSAKSKSVSFKAVIIASLFISFIYLMAILSASNLSMYGNLNIKSQEAIPYLIDTRLSGVMRGIAYATIFFIASTTLVGLWNTIASVFIAHHIKSIKQRSIKRSVLITAIIAICTYFLANLFIDNVFQKMVLMNIPIASLAFALLGGFYWNRVSVLSASISIAVGFFGGFFCYFYFGEPIYMWYWAVTVIPLEFIVGIAVTLFYKKSISAANHIDGT